MAPQVYTHLIAVGRQRSDWVDDHHVPSSVGVDQAAGVPLPQHMDHTGLVEVDEVRYILDLVQTGRVSLRRRTRQNSKH